MRNSSYNYKAMGFNDLDLVNINQAVFFPQEDERQRQLRERARRLIAEARAQSSVVKPETVVIHKTGEEEIKETKIIMAPSKTITASLPAANSIDKGRHGYYQSVGTL